MSESASENATLHLVGEDQPQKQTNCYNFDDLKKNEGKQKQHIIKRRCFLKCLSLERG